MSPPWMPLYWGDYLKDTRDLSTLQHGAYFLLIGHYWQHSGLPTDEKQLAAIAGLGVGKWKTIRDPIAAKFQDGWKHHRIDDELAKAEKKLVQRAISGSKGGTAAAIARAKALAFATPNFVPNAAANGLAKTQQKRTSHNHIRTTTITEAAREESPEVASNGPVASPLKAVSPELAAYVARKANR